MLYMEDGGKREERRRRNGLDYTLKRNNEVMKSNFPSP